MFVGILFTVMVSLVIGLFSTLTFYMRSSVNRQFAGPETKLFAYFWLAMAAVWYTTAVVDLFRYIGEDTIAIGAVYILQIFVGLVLVIAAHYFEFTLFKGQKRMLVSVCYGFFYAFFLFSLFRFGAQVKPESFFIAQTLSSRPTLIIFAIGFLPLWIAAVYDFFRTVTHRIARDASRQQFHILGSLAFILIGIAGSLDEMGIVSGWMVTAARLVTLVAAILAYFSISSLSEPEEMVV